MCIPHSSAKHLTSLFIVEGVLWYFNVTKWFDSERREIFVHTYPSAWSFCVCFNDVKIVENTVGLPELEIGLTAGVTGWGGCLLLLETWSYIWYIQHLHYSPICISPGPMELVNDCVVYHFILLILASKFYIYNKNSEVNNVYNVMVIQKANTKWSMGQHGPSKNAKVGSSPMEK
jgi:hypothetical protein